MPSVRRLSAQTPARLVLLVLTFVCVGATAAFLCARPPASSACEVVLPKPLRVRYTESALVAVGRAVESVAVEPGGDSQERKTTLRITSLLKGESRERIVHLYHYLPEEADGKTAQAYSKDDVLLVFLNPNENGEGYVPVDYERGVNKLSPDDLKVYLSRIEELAPIIRRAKPDVATITEWLVRCAEEPATRWEGAYDLGFGLSVRVDPEESGAEANVVAASAGDSLTFVKADAGQVEHDEADASAVRAATTISDAARPNDVNESGERAGAGEFVPDLDKQKDEKQIEFGALLAPAHKERLTLALLAAEELDEGGQWLFRLVGNWKDARLVPFGLKHLTRIADKPPYYAEELMQIIADTLGDQMLNKFVADYSKSASYADADEDDGEDAEEDREATAEERAERKKEFEEIRAAATEARRWRSGQLRHFLALAAQPQKP